MLVQSIGGGGGNGGNAVAVGYGASLALGGSGGSGGHGGKVSVNVDGGIQTSGDSANAIEAQSIGGGGGNGGVAISVAAGTSGSIGVSVGGSGGSGGNGSDVDVDSWADIATSGESANGVIAQSIGGGGGNGGAAVSASLSPATSIGVTVGGSGGGGGNGGNVTVDVNDGSITTTNANSNAIQAQSIGGGGGNGGLSVAVSGGSGAVGISLGGSGDAGGSGGRVAVDNSVTLKTIGDNSTAILAQSIGGGGGNGGLSVAAAAGGAAATVSIGGNGGAGGTGGEVTVTNTGQITTAGDYSYGIAAQSIGGGGGNGGGSISVSASGGPYAGSVGLSLGGGGGAGGTAGAVTVSNVAPDAPGSTNISTRGDGSSAILAQSIGGGGGAGGYSVAATISGGSNGSAAASVALGGAGGDGGTAGALTVANDGTLITEGNLASAIVAQSIGGDGGSGGTAVAGSINISGARGVAASVSLGGNGGKGGTGAGVSVTNKGAIVTHGDLSNGILAQSIGGTGGSGGVSVSGSINVSGGSGGSVGVSLGGSGRKGGAGGSVAVTNEAGLTTLGDLASGIVAQSVGGDGGSGGMSVTGALNASGSSGGAASVTVGGSGGTGGTGGSVTVANDGKIVTLGDLSYGILAQSIGGNGGSGGIAVAGALSGSGGSGGSIGVGVGGSGGIGGTGGTVTVTNKADITTTGYRSSAIVAQSIGGDGGTGGLSVGVSGTASQSLAAALSVAIGGDGGVGGHADAVTVTNTGNIVMYGASGVDDDDEDSAGEIETVGADSYAAIVAQSIGGSGGMGGAGGSGTVTLGSRNSLVGSVTIGGSGGTGGASGMVSVDNSGDILGFSNEVMGIVAQSIGGNGGTGGASVSVDFSQQSAFNANFSATVGGSGGGGGTAGNVHVDNSGTVVTKGDSAYAILAQSIGGNGGNGGLAVSLSGSLTTGSGQSVNLGVTVGGAGGAGGKAGDIDVMLADKALLVTRGENAPAVIAQSIGGSGGTGGLSVSVTGTYSAGTVSGVPLNLGVSVGGLGGDGGKSGNVHVATEDGTAIYTAGDFSYGILAQSVGGNGGNGGGAVSGILNIAPTGNPAIDVAVSVGGSGGAGATAGKVTIDNGATVVTGDPDDSSLGQYAHGIVAQSIGGSGGTGGWSSAITFSAGASGQSAGTVNMSMSIGGGGGTGEDAGKVDVTNSGTVVAYGEGAFGILAQSIGGGGGAGGSTSFDPSLDDISEFEANGGAISGGTGANTYNYSGAVGGFGGVAGDGDSVAVTNGGDIWTYGVSGHAIVAQSIGGGGGVGGNSTSASLAATASLSTTIAVSVGGSGGAAGDGGNVIVNNEGQIVTAKEGAYGIYAQSVGGGGGTGGDANSWTLQTKDAALGKNVGQSFQVSLAIGGAGGAGGDGGAVAVNNSGNIYTQGAGSYGIFAQSVGGGGGDGGGAKTSAGVLTALLENDQTNKNNWFRTGKYKMTVGGLGGSAGDGNLVTVDNSGNIFTVGDQATAIYAQSVGGGGGAGGNSDAGLDGNLVIGGWGGSGGRGDEVLVSNTGTISTQGSSAHGIFAQSIGGGGGDGGNADFGNADSIRNEMIKAFRKEGKNGITAVFKKFAEKFKTVNLGVSVGGFGGSAGDGGNVTVCSGGTFTGSSGDCEGGDAKGSIRTTGDGSHGIVAQSVGGGGGIGGSTTLSKLGKIGVGGLGGVAGDGGDVAVSNHGNITTTGAGAYGILAQSVGGGGGIGGDITLGIDVLGEDSSLLSRGYDEGTVGDVVGALEASLADPDVLSEVITSLTGSYRELDGILNTADDVVAFVSALLQYDFDTGPFDVSINGTSVTLEIGELLAGTDGDGGNVTVDHTGDIVVTGGAVAGDEDAVGAGSVGIFAQSVGGGGGIVGNTTTVSEAELGIDINDDGDMADSFEVSDGTAFAGTTGGNGNGGDVSITSSGNVVAGCLNCIGIFAQSVGGTDGGTNGDITINVDDGLVMGGLLYGDGSGIAAAIIIDGGNDNTLSIGENAMVYALSGQAITGSGGNETIRNSGYIAGNISLGSGDNSLHNSETGEIETGHEIDLGDDEALFYNAGLLDLGGYETVRTVTLTGSYEQSATGTIYADVHFGDGEASDLLIVSGSAKIDGVINANLMSLAHVGDTVTIIKSEDGTFGDMANNTFASRLGSESGLPDVLDTLTVDFGVITSGEDVKLAINKVDFSPENPDQNSSTKLSRNETEAGDYLNRIVMGEGSVALGTFIADIANLQDFDTYKQVMNRVTPESYAAKLAPTLFASQRFSTMMQNCPEGDRQGAIVMSGECMWLRIANLSEFDKDGSAGFGSTQESSHGYQAGFQLNIAPSWYVGGAIGYDMVSTVAAISSSTGDRLSLGGFVKYKNDDWLVSLAASGGHSWYETQRFTDLASLTSYAGAAQAEDQISNANFQLRTARSFHSGDWYVTPALDMNVFYLQMNEGKESGAGALNLNLQQTGQWVFGITPSLETGFEYTDPATGVVYRPHLGAGVTVYNRDYLGVDATFEGAPASAGTFRATSDLDQVTANFSAGLDIRDPDDQFGLRLSYEGRIGERTESHAGKLEFGVKF
ncbi:hypothetical protein E2A64_03070 [Pseudohoeflea suaedae]|uniref:Autotransporter domain-containing protein n=1 Tax=Pseudohoeflea suaedae TaxID=877384 RepID=A0A4R5PMA3_9HYPH|nr:hypothetical protein E2A64_03070 [Pseudohoeflea suaedae]